MLTKALRDRALDLLVSREILAQAELDLSAERLFRDRLVVVSSEAHPLARRRKLALRDLLD